MESDALDYLHILESYYPMDCYESAKVTYNMRNRQSGMPFSGSSEGMAFSNNTGNVIELYPEYFGGVSKRSQSILVTMMSQIINISVLYFHSRTKQ